MPRAIAARMPATGPGDEAAIASAARSASCAVVVSRIGLAAQRAQLRGGRVQLGDHAIVTLLATQLDSGAVHLFDRSALVGERMHGHERRAHRRLREAEIVRARDLEGLAERVQRLRGVAAAGAHVDQPGLRPAERGDVRSLLLERERAQVRALREVELTEQVMELREREGFRELAGAVGEEREHRFGLEVCGGR